MSYPKDFPNRERWNGIHPNQKPLKEGEHCCLQYIENCVSAKEWNFRATTYFHFWRCFPSFDSVKRQRKTALGISFTNKHKTLLDHLAAKKVCSRWIPHNLTKAQKDEHLHWCKQMPRNTMTVLKKTYIKL